MEAAGSPLLDRLPTLGEAVAAKLARNEVRYPVEKARGSNKKHNEL